MFIGHPFQTKISREFHPRIQAQMSDVYCAFCPKSIVLAAVHLVVSTNHWFLYTQFQTQHQFHLVQSFVNIKKIANQVRIALRVSACAHSISPVIICVVH
mmetsp:Transcript_20504/g.48168  ORF Transcript_20504/g.48168 Transcript_20504/m.48168 type:complete len:100 (+) Transcript_20504:28-327(+)